MHEARHARRALRGTCDARRAVREARRAPLPCAARHVRPVLRGHYSISASEAMVRAGGA